MLRSGTLRHRLEVQASTETHNEYGEDIPSWSTAFSIWANVQPMSGTERADGAAANQIQNERTYKITARYNASITPKHRIKWGTRIFDINSVVDPDERKRDMTLTATEAV